MKWFGDLINPVVLILLPMIPAFVFFKLLPGKAFVKGVLKGWNIKLTGGFAAYFALVLLILPVFWPRESTEMWKVEGKIVLNATGDNTALVNSVQIRLVPDNVDFFAAGEFELKIPVVKHRNKERVFQQSIDFILDGYLSPPPVRFTKEQSPILGGRSYPIIFDYSNMTARIDKDIVLYEK